MTEENLENIILGHIAKELKDEIQIGRQVNLAKTIMQALRIHDVVGRSEQLETIEAELRNSSLPNEEEVLQTIFDCVFIRGINLEDYKCNFTNEQSGLYNSLVKLFMKYETDRS